MRQIRAVLAGVALLALVVGVPVLLVRYVGLPGTIAPGDWARALSTQVDSSFVIGVFSVVVWLAWLNFLFSLLVEANSLIGELRGRPRVAWNLPLNFGGQQIARRLLVTAIAGVVGVSALGPTAAMASATNTAPSTATSITTGAAVSSSTSAIAATDDASAATSARHSSTSQVSTPQVADNDRTAQTPDNAQALPTYVVQGTPGNHDNLWDIAETHLGDPLRWHEIWDLNHTRVMGDGDRFEHPELIHPGWVLTMPADAVDLPTVPAAPAAVPAAPTAGSSSGAGSSAAGSTGADEGVASAPSVDAPEADQSAAPPEAAPAVPAPAATAEDTTPSPSTSASGDSSASAAIPGSSPAASNAPSSASSNVQTTPQASSEDNPAGDDSDASVVNVRTVGGIGALLAAGLLGAVALRRRRRDSHRRAGFRAADPQGLAAEAEDSLLGLHTPMSFDLIDRGLRRLSADLADRDLPLPGIVTARLDEQGLLLTLFDAAELPSPWSRADEDGFEWLLSAQDAAEDEDDIDVQVPAPWPSLVTLGHDDQDAQVLVDLEELLALNIAAENPQQSQDMLNALALELATTPWGAGLQVTLVGCCEDLADLVPERMRFLPDMSRLMRELEVRRADVTRVLTESGLQDVAQARQDVEAADVWSPHIILVGHPLDAGTQASICDLLNDLPRVGIAAVTTAEDGLGEWGLNLDVSDPSWAELTPLRTRLRPQVLGGQEYASVLELLDSAAQEATQPAGHVFQTPTAEPELLKAIPTVIDLTALEQAEEPAVSAADPHAWAGDPTDWPEFTDEASVDLNSDLNNDLRSDLQRDLASDLESDLESDAVACEETATARAADLLRSVGFDERIPMLRVLGPVDADLNGESMGLTGRQLALGIYFAMNPGASSRDVIEDFFRQRTAPTTLHPRVAELRKSLGVHPETGEPLVALNTAAAGYRLHESVLTDWELLQRLVASDDIDHLETALSLVQGVPFARIGSRATRYYVWSERLERDIRQLVTDVAFTVAMRAQDAGQFLRAERAAAKGLLLEPGHEQLRRVQWCALAALNEREALRRSVEELAQVNEELGCDEDPDTVTLIDQLRAQGALKAA